MTPTPIDVWNLETFDGTLLAELNARRDLLRNYELTRKRNFLEQQAAERWVPLKSNPYAAERNYVVEQVITTAMEQRTIRAWHYTRLTDDETALLKSGGVYVSTLEHIRRRLDVQVSARTLSAETADALYAASPFHHQHGSRAGKFWMISHPVAADNSGVELLLGHWGGEGVYFWLKDPELIERVKSFGRPRVIELAIPLEVTRHAYSAAKAVVATFLRTPGCDPDWSAFDLYTTSALGADAVLNIHTEGEPLFAALARGYPAGCAFSTERPPTLQSDSSDPFNLSGMSDEELEAIIRLHKERE
jgi:hypothetical protein